LTGNVRYYKYKKYLRTYFSLIIFLIKSLKVHLRFRIIYMLFSAYFGIISLQSRRINIKIPYKARGTEGARG